MRRREQRERALHRTARGTAPTLSPRRSHSPLRPPALLARTGLAPLHATLERARAPDSLLDSFTGLPSLAWALEAGGLDGCAAADALALAGAVLGAAILAGPPRRARSPALLALLAALWVSLANLLPPHLARPGDGLLAEALAAAALAAVETATTTPCAAPAALLRWVAAKHLFLTGRAGLAAGRAAWFGGGALSGAAGAAARLVAAPLALAPVAGARAAAGAVLAGTGLAAARASGWHASLQAALALPLLWPAASAARRRTPTALSLAAASALIIPAGAALAQLLASGQAPILGGRRGGAALDEDAVAALLARAAPWLAGAGAAAVGAAGAGDLWRAVGPADEEEAGEPPLRPPALPSSPPPPPPPRHLSEALAAVAALRERAAAAAAATAAARAAAPPWWAAPAATALGGACLAIVAAGAAEVVAGRGGGGCSACGQRGLFSLAMRRARFALRPWRVAGDGGPVQPPAPPASAGMVLEAAAACGEGEEEGEAHGPWARLAPPARPPLPFPALGDPPRLASALAAAEPVRVGGPGGGSGDAAPPWVDLLVGRLLQGGAGPDPVRAAATGRGGAVARAPRPCALRVVGRDGALLLHPTRAGDADQALRLAQAGIGPLVEGQYAAATAPPGLVAALGAPREGGGAGLALLVLAAAGLAWRRGRPAAAGPPAQQQLADKKRA